METQFFGGVTRLKSILNSLLKQELWFKITWFYKDKIKLIQKITWTSCVRTSKDKMALLILNHTYPIAGLMIFHMVIKLKLAKFKVMRCFIPRQITCRHPDPMIVHCAQITTYSLLLNLSAITTCYKIL